METQTTTKSVPKSGEVKFVIKSIIPVTSDFTDVIKSSNDSSMDNLLEFRSLMSNSFKVNSKSSGDTKEDDKSYSDDVKQFIQKILDRKKIPHDESIETSVACDEIKNDSGCKSEQSDSSRSISDMMIAKKQKINNSRENSTTCFVTMTSSTPIKFLSKGENLDISGVDFLKNTSLNDSDFESMDQDQYDDETRNAEKNDELTLIMTEANEQNTPKKESFLEISRSSSLVSLKNSIKAIQKVFTIDKDSKSKSSSSSKKSKFLNIFYSSEKFQKKTSSSKKPKKSGSIKKQSKLTIKNVKKYLNAAADKENIDRPCDKMENSFICEPSSSDIDENEILSNYISYNKSLDSSIEFLKSPLVPTFKIEPPSDASSIKSTSSSILISQNNPAACEYAKHIIKCSYASRFCISPLRRTFSEPFSCMSNDNLETDSDMMEFAFSQFNTTKTSQASIKNLPQISAKQMSSEISPFKRWGQSSLRARADIRTPLARRPSSLAVSENDVYAKTMQDQDDDAFCGSTRNTTKEIVPVGPTTWGQSFELLLNDTAGLHTFAEFLKKEFSGENIYFWTACERFRHIDDISERAKEALAIFDKHLASGALEPVNIDSHARNTAQERLLSAEKDLFIHAQKQIFNLMKFDSYQRFIRSDLYKSCLDAEQKKIPLPYPGDQLDPILRISTHQQTSNSTMIKLKKSLSNAEDRRRKSILPWNRKTRCKSKDRGEVENIDSIKNSASSTNTLKLVSNHSAGDIHSSRSSLSSFDATISKIYSYDNDVGNRSSLCRVILSNGATTIVQTKPNETIRELVERLLEKRGIYYQAYEAFLSGNTKPLDIDGLSTQLAGNEVLIEQRVIFKLDLPNRKVISVKSKTCKILSDVLRPILHKYNYRLDLIQAYGKAYGPDALDLSLPVTAIDGQRLQIVCNDNGEMKPTNSFKLGNAPVTFVRANKLSTSASDPQLNTLDEITNKVFNELLQGKVNASNENESDDWGSETSSGIFNRMLRNPNKNKQATSKTSGGSDEGENAIRKPLIAKLKAGVKLQVTQNRTQNDETLLEGLKRAQRSRLEDQRGTEINFELPEFLKDKEKFASMGNKLRKTKFDESPSNSISLYNNIDAISESNHEQSKAAAASIHYTQQRRPQPAPRLSIAGKSPTKPSPEVSSVKSKIHSLENAIMLNSPTSSGKLFVNSRSNTPNELNASIQCLPSNTPMKSRSSDSPIYYSPDNGGSCICADTTMVFNHHHPNSSYESASDAIGFYSSGSQNDYQEIDDANGNRTSFKNEQEIHNCPPLLPPKPKIIPIKMSNWQSTNKENFFKVPLERRAPIAEGGVKNDVYLDQPTSSFV